MANENLGCLIYKASGGNKGRLCYKHGDVRLAYKAEMALSAIQAMTEWQFDKSTFGAPYAYINKRLVCPGHATTHIVSYQIGEGGNIEDYYNPGTGCYEFIFTMWLDIHPFAGMEFLAGGPCTFRCWNKAYSSFDEAPADERSSIDGDDTKAAEFKVTLNKTTLKWKFQAIGMVAKPKLEEEGKDGSE